MTLSTEPGLDDDFPDRGSGQQQLGPLIAQRDLLATHIVEVIRNRDASSQKAGTLALPADRAVQLSFRKRFGKFFINARLH
jgi:hypothetical protein